MNMQNKIRLNEAKNVLYLINGGKSEPTKYSKAEEEQARKFNRPAAMFKMSLIF
jgi:hypothetical protein